MVQALEAGKHVVVDKIMCLSLDEGRRMIEAARAGGRGLLRLPEPALGLGLPDAAGACSTPACSASPTSIESAVTSFGPSPGYRNPTSDRPRGWRTYAEFGGGPMRDWGAHLFDQAVQLAGPDPLAVFGDLQYRRDWDVETAGTAWMRYPAGGRPGDGRRGAALHDRDGVHLRPAEATLADPRLGRGVPPVRAGRAGGRAAPGRGGPTGDGRRVRAAGRALRWTARCATCRSSRCQGTTPATTTTSRAAIRGEVALAVEPEDVLHVDPPAPGGPPSARPRPARRRGMGAERDHDDHVIRLAGRGGRHPS